MSLKNAKILMLESKSKSTFKNQLTLDNERHPILALTSNCDVSNSEAKDYEVNIIVNEFQHKYLKPQEIYFITDDKIKEGDWQYTITHGITKVKNLLWSEQECAKKVIATTDSSLTYIKHDDSVPYPKGEQIFLPKPSKSFIEKFIDMYNKNTPITDVLIEYWDHTEEDIQLKINSNNEITIKRIKDSWNRKEVIDLFSKYQYDYAQWVLKMEYDLENKPTPVEWINKNL